jgi:hypothetical protein
MTLGLSSRQDIIESDRADLLTVDDDGNPLAWQELLCGLITVRTRAGVDLDLAVYNVDDPVDGDPGLGIGRAFLASVLSERRVGDFDHNRHVGTFRNPVLVIILGATND